MSDEAVVNVNINLFLQPSHNLHILKIIVQQFRVCFSLLRHLIGSKLGKTVSVPYPLTNYADLSLLLLK